MQRAFDSAALTLLDVDALAPRMLGIDEHRNRTVRFFRHPTTDDAWKPYERWMTTIVDLDTRTSARDWDGRDSVGVGDWLLAQTLQWRVDLQVLAIDPSAAFRKALLMWLPGDRRLGRCIPSGQARQRHAHRSPATRNPAGRGWSARRDTAWL
ncbi:hypothetical protein StoSoilA2_34150 [Arthrobacter sp. StoSoilA2]|nr:hypothetical protein StoSoilA2_34150 [Arthrobacter sp. StoSoilA2]